MKRVPLHSHLLSLALVFCVVINHRSGAAVTSGFAFLPNPVVLEKEKKLEREQNECDALDAVGDYM